MSRSCVVVGRIVDAPRARRRHGRARRAAAPVWGAECRGSGRGAGCVARRRVSKLEIRASLVARRARKVSTNLRLGNRARRNVFTRVERILTIVGHSGRWAKFAAAKWRYSTAWQGGNVTFPCITPKGLIMHSFQSKLADQLKTSWVVL